MRYDIDGATSWGALKAHGVVFIAPDEIFEPQEAPFGQHSEFDGHHRWPLSYQITLNECVLGYRSRELQVLYLFSDLKLAFEDNDHDRFTDYLALFDQNLVLHGFLFFEELRYFDRSIPRDALEVGQTPNYVKHFLLFFRSVLLHHK